jgi:hypothetical protein
LLFDVGAVNENDASDNRYDPNLLPSSNGPRAGTAGLTVKVVVTDEFAYCPLLACVAVIVLVPAPTIVTVRDAIVATLVFDDEYVNAPLLFDDGSVRVNELSPYVFVGIVASGPMVGKIPTVGELFTQFDVDPAKAKFVNVPFLAEVEESFATDPDVESSL